VPKNERAHNWLMTSQIDLRLAAIRRSARKPPSATLLSPFLQRPRTPTLSTRTTTPPPLATDLAAHEVRARSAALAAQTAAPPSSPLPPPSRVCVRAPPPAAGGSHDHPIAAPVAALARARGCTPPLPARTAALHHPSPMPLPSGGWEGACPSCAIPGRPSSAVQCPRCRPSRSRCPIASHSLPLNYLIM